MAVSSKHSERRASVFGASLRVNNDLLKIERDTKEPGVSGDQLKLMREQEAQPILDKMKDWDLYSLTKRKGKTHLFLDWRLQNSYIRIIRNLLYTSETALFKDLIIQNGSI